MVEDEDIEERVKQLSTAEREGAMLLSGSDFADALWDTRLLDLFLKWNNNPILEANAQTVARWRELHAERYREQGPYGVHIKGIQEPFSLSFVGGSELYLGVRVVDCHLSALSISGSDRQKLGSSHGRGGVNVEGCGLGHLVIDGGDMSASSLRFRNCKLTGEFFCFFDSLDELYFSDCAFSDVIMLSKQRIGKLKFEGCTFQNGISMEETRVDFMKFGPARVEAPYFASFRGLRVQTVATFSHAELGGGLVLDKCHVSNGGHLHVAHCSSPREISMRNATVEGTAGYDGTDCDSVINLNDSHFAVVPDLRAVNAKLGISTSGMTIDEPGISSLWGHFQLKGNREEAEKFRALKRLAGDNRDRDSEIHFHARELKASVAGSELAKRVSQLLVAVYAIWSNYGRSVVRPVAATLIAVALSAAYYTPSLAPAAVGKAFYLGFTTTLPFFPWSRDFRQETMEYLMCNDSESCALVTELSMADHAVIFSSSFVGIVSVFLIGLALRNRLRL